MYDVNEIKKILPHRYPFLLIDRVEELKMEEGYVRAIKCVTANEEFFNGHFPVMPVMPGVLILEALAQTGAFLVLNMDEYKGKIALFAGANNVKWRRQVVPGDKLVLECNIIGQIRHGLGKGTCVASVDGEVCCQADIMFSVK